MADLYKLPAGWRIYWNSAGVHATNGKVWLFQPFPFWPATNDMQRLIEGMQ